MTRPLTTVPGGPSLLRAVLLSEFTKLRTVRSTAWTLASTTVITVVTGTLLCLLTRYAAHEMTAADRATLDPTATSLSGMVLGQLAIILFGVLAASGEFATGMLTASVQAVPQRGLLLTCKAAIVGTVALLTGCLTSFTAFLIGQATLGSLAASLGDPGVLRAVLGGGLYMASLALFALGITMALRTSVLALGILIPFFFLISPLLGALPATSRFAAYLPDAAGSRITEVHPAPGPLGPWPGFGVLTLWVAMALAMAYATLRGRDVRQG
ncbi:ABC transporter permease [Streptomyces sp. GS7]|uniref:ABC transporter permease n=1 Tax=Streptomyces sp. GS7 TaxID=2692234 RepID=UPI001316F2EA|nr:ABC transporter permease [Streptomyces sp. GS7]QHC24911.1 ABC transporter permease [Streptomyces sp. GS7]